MLARTVVTVRSFNAGEAMQKSMHVALEELCARMTVEEKVAAITQFDIMEVMDVEAGMRGDFALDEAKLRRLAKAGVGSFLNSPTAGGPLGKLRCPTAAQWRGAMQQLEDAYLEEGKVRLLAGIPTNPYCMSVYDRCRDRLCFLRL
jgi:hypothetical protein